MKIILLPNYWDAPLTLAVQGEGVIINGEFYDLSSAIPQQDMFPWTPDNRLVIDNPYVFGPVERIDGVLTITIYLPYVYGASYERLNPEPIIDPPDGPIELPE